MRSHELPGTWLLKSIRARGEDGTDVEPVGATPKGFISYLPSGYMSVIWTSSERTKFASQDPLGGQPDEIKAAFEAMDAYAGTYEYDEATGAATHHVEVARLPNWEGTKQIRHVRMVDDELVIETPAIFSRGQNWVVTLTWTRADAVPVAHAGT